MTSESQRRQGQGNDSHSHRGLGPHRGRGPVGYQRSDERLREMICESLEQDDQVDASQIEVTVKSGEVTLTGTVPDRRTKREAEECACTVSGVHDVQNQLRVKDDRQSSQSGQQGQSGQSSQSTQSNQYGQSGQSGQKPATSQGAYANGKSESDQATQDKKPRA